jgi:hypothetical protein
MKQSPRPQFTYSRDGNFCQELTVIVYTVPSPLCPVYTVPSLAIHLLSIWIVQDYPQCHA